MNIQNMCLNSWLPGFCSSWGLMRGGYGVLLGARDCLCQQCGVKGRGRSHRGGIISVIVLGKEHGEGHSLEREQPKQRQGGRNSLGLWGNDMQPEWPGLRICWRSGGRQTWRGGLPDRVQMALHIIPGSLGSRP